MASASGDAVPSGSVHAVCEALGSAWGPLQFSEAGESSFRAFLTQILSRFYDPMPGSCPSARLGLEGRCGETEVAPHSWQTFGQNKGMAVPPTHILPPLRDSAPPSDQAVSQITGQVGSHPSSIPCPLHAATRDPSPDKSRAWSHRCWGGRSGHSPSFQPGQVQILLDFQGFTETANHFSIQPLIEHMPGINKVHVPAPLQAPLPSLRVPKLLPRLGSPSQLGRRRCENTGLHPASAMALWFILAASLVTRGLKDDCVSGVWQDRLCNLPEVCEHICSPPLSSHVPRQLPPGQAQHWKGSFRVGKSIKS